MMPKRKLLREFAHEIIQSKYLMVAVEGYSDKHFYESWASSRDLGSRLAAVCIDSLEVSPELLHRLGLTDSNRSRVLAVCAELSSNSDRFRGIVDRDTGQDLDRELPDCLLVTDYPAIESYALGTKVFETLNKIVLHENFGGSEDLLKDLTVALRDLWEIRLQNPNLEQPNYKSGMKGAGGIGEFDSRAATGIREIVLPSDDGVESEVVEDIRHYAYGHDIAALIFSADQNYFKNRRKFSGPESLEASFMAAIAMSSHLDDELLFRSLADWLASEE